MLECTAYGASNLLDDVVIGEWIIASVYCMKFSFSSVNSVWHNYIVPLQCADIINNYWLRIVADASHSFQWCGWWWWWSSTTTTTHTNEIDGNSCGRTVHYGWGSPYDCESWWSWCMPRTRTKSIQWLQGFPWHETPDLQGGWGAPTSWWVVEYS